MTKIYEERDRAASNSYTLHYVNLKSDIIAYGDIDALRTMFKGNITFKRSASGMKTTCYFHLFRDQIVKGVASGCGYDTQSAAIYDALVALSKNAENQQNKELVLSLLDGFNDGTSWKDHFNSKGVFSAHIGG